ncbi:MAG: gamma-glutamylcyclotransferase family protein [Gammaproteobacteria bacterium]
MSVWYFAYGANMGTEVLVRRCGVRPLRSEAARLEGYRLVFTQAGVPIIEPCFASIEAAPGEAVYGVVHNLAVDTAEHLDQFEGPTCERIAVSVEGSKKGSITAWTYRARHPIAGLVPSKRYLNLIIDGAREFALPEHYVQSLESQPVIHIPIVSTLVTVFVRAIERSGRASGLVRRGAHRFVQFLQSAREPLISPRGSGRRAACHGLVLLYRPCAQQAARQARLGSRETGRFDRTLAE